MTETHESVRTDQTLFAAQEPYLDSGRSAFDQPAPPTPQPWFRQPRLLMAVGGVVVLLFVITVAALMMTNGSSPMTLIDPSPTPKTKSTGKYASELKQLKDDLQKADPTQKELPFPPINPEISL